ncbi:hypothetical protein R6Q59_010125 [Mikania micrantha]
MSLSRTSSLERSLSIEETYALASVARRKSSSESARKDLRQQLGHAQLLEVVENVIRSSPPPSPRQSTSEIPSSKHISWQSLEVTKRYTPPPPPPPPVRPAEEVDEYGFSYDDDEEDLDSLSLMRTPSRRF